MVIDPEITVAFTGNREMLPQGDLLANMNLEEEIRNSLSKLLTTLITQGKRSFLVGGAVGFDMLAAEVVLDLREIYPEIQLIVVIPFEGQEMRYSEADKLRYSNITLAANGIETISDKGFNMAAYHIRNEFMVTNSSMLIAYSNGKGRGSASTIRRAIKLGVPIINIYQTISKSASEEQLLIEF